jgi:pyridoxamine 5'-phosphate oxidase
VDLADLLPDPLAQFRRWLDDALAAGIAMPEAMTLATADASGRPSARTVLLKGLDERGFSARGASSPRTPTARSCSTGRRSRAGR